MDLTRRSVTRVLGLGTAALAFALSLAAAPAYAAPIRLMLDAGHGGSDSGAVGNGIQEKDTSLRIAKLVETSAKRQGWTVAQTRRTDAFVGLQQRPAAAARFHATDFVSIHSNSTGGKTLGSMTIYRTPQSAKLGASIMKQLAPQTSYPDIGNQADTRGLAVLRHAPTTAVLVEVLSVDSVPESKALKSPQRQRDFAEAIVKGIAVYHHVTYRPPAAPPRPKPAAAASETTAPLSRTATDSATATRPAAASAGTQTTAPSEAPRSVAGTPSARTLRSERAVATPRMTPSPTPAQDVLARLAAMVSVLFR